MRSYRPTHRADVRTAGAVVLGIAGAVLTATALVAGTAGSAGAEPPPEQVCQDLDSGKIDTTGDPETVTIVAPEGFLIDAYCVKSGSTNGENGPVYVDVDPPAAEVTISYPGGKAVSHYSVSFVPIPTPTETVTETPTETPSETITETPTETITETPTETLTETPTETPTETLTETPTETLTETPTGTITVSPSETESPVETPSGSASVPSESATPTEDLTVRGSETATPGGLPTVVDAGSTGVRESGLLRLAGIALGLLLLIAAAALGLTGRERGAHQI